MLLRQTLLLDADDTLWHNTIYFEEAISTFLSLLDRAPHSPTQVRDRLNSIEMETIRDHGYGSGSFERSLLRCYEELSLRPLNGRTREHIREFAQAVSKSEIELLSGVAESLPRLGAQHTLILVTKGNHAEQSDKLTRSGLAKYFSAVEILREKDTAAYIDLIQRQGLNPRTTWMIGNSPRSDINPALDAGLHAAYIRSTLTWVLEDEELRNPKENQHLLKCNSFTELTAYLLS